MALMTAQEYVESLRKLNTRVYMFGEKIENWVDHPMIRPSINCVAMTYALAQDPQVRGADDCQVQPYGPHHQPLHPPASVHRGPDEQGEDAAPAGPEDRRLLPALRGHGRPQRRVHTTYEIDARHGTGIPPAFVEFVQRMAGKGLDCGRRHDRSPGRPGLAPHAQKDPDMFLRVVERREDGIVVRGAKMHHDRRPSTPHQIPRHAHADHARGRPGLCRGLLRPRR